ncbi:hypothetical protein ACFRCG_06635 [Embleya sp. NPDC056575]|uniref:hypothetical protein n=1 Tax=unclassified Embleya TaxID=2699296 RepID=UPI0036CA3471
MYPEPDVLVARLARWCQGGGCSEGVGPPASEPPSFSVAWPPTEEYLERLAERLGLHRHDLFLVAGVALPEEAWFFDDGAGGVLSQLVQRALSPSEADRRRLRDDARSMPVLWQALARRKPQPYEEYPPGFGGLLVEMFALRNLDWASGAEVMYSMSGVYRAASTIGRVGRGERQPDADLLDGFAAVLGVPVGVLVSLTGVHHPDPQRPIPAKVVDTAALLWDVRHLTVGQVRQLSEPADALGRK